MVMRTVSEMRSFFNVLPDDALCYAYEGEVTGVVVQDKNHKQIAFIHASEWSNESIKEQEDYVNSS